MGPAADEYAVDIADNDQRNMTIHQIVGAYNEGIITADTYIWKEGMADWQTLAEVKAVANALHAAARPVAAAAMPAAVRRADHGASADLFGSIDTAGGEDDITTSAPDAAPMMSAGTGARNESSVLFSLSALTGTPNASPTQGGGAKRRGADDSGLIDLQALTAAEAAGGGGGFAASAHPFGASPLISAPLGGVSGPALGGALGSAYGGRRSGSRTLVIAATVLAISIIGGAAAVVVNRGGAVEAEATSSLDKAAASGTEKVTADPRDPEPANAEPGSPEPSEPGTEAAGDLVAADELPAAAPETAVVKAPVSRPAAPRVARTPTRAKAPTPAPEPDEPEASKPEPASTSSSASGEDKKKKKKAAVRCDCKPADLMCAMRCSAKK